MNTGIINKIALGAVIVGSINWGLISIAKFDLVQRIALMIPLPSVDMILKGIVGVAGIYVAYLWYKGQVKA